MTYLEDNLPRLHVGTGWTELTIESEVGVLKTARGYAPGVVVRRAETPHLFLVGAASLAVPLEALREKRGGSLKGAVIRVRKTRPDQTAPYEVEGME